MKRVLAACCFTWFFTKLIAAYLPPAVFWLLAAFFVCVFVGSLITKRHDYSRLLPCVGMVALIFHFINISVVVNPVFALAGQKADVVLLVEEAAPGFQDGTIRGRFTVEELNGKRLNSWKQFQVSCSSFPEAERGERLQGAIQLEELEQNEYYYGNLADGVLLSAQTEGNFLHVGQSHKLRFLMKELQEILSKSGRRYLPQEEGSVLSAMALGDKSHLSKDTKEIYRAAGVSHLLVVSGLHLTLLCGAFLGNKPCGGRFRRLKAVSVMLLVLFMMTFTGFTPSVTRAGVAALIFYLGAFLLLPADSLTSLGVAAVILSLRNCYAVCDLGLQLSFAATFGVLAAVAITRRSLSYELKEEHIWHYRFNKAIQVVLVPVFAALFTLPIQLFYGISVSGVSVLTNLLTMPLISPIIVFGLLASIFGAFSLEFAARFFALIAGILIKTLNHIVEFTAALSIAQLNLPREYTIFVVLVLFALIWIAWKLRRLRWMIPVVPCLLLIASLIYGELQTNIVSIDMVGNRSNPCAVISCQNQAMVLFKGGESNRKKVEETLHIKGIDVPALWIDLRKEPKVLEVNANQIITVEGQAEKQAQTVNFRGIIVTLVHTKNANLAVLEEQGYRIAMLAGTLQAGTSLKADLLLTGASAPGAIEPNRILTASDYDWQKEYPDTIFYYAPQGGSVQIRPGKSVQFKGGRACYIANKNCRQR